MKGVGKTAGEGRRIREREFESGYMEIVLRRGFDSVDARPHFGNIQVHFQNPVLSPEELNQNGKICLNCFP